MSQAPRLRVSRPRADDVASAQDEGMRDLRAHSFALEMQNRELRESHRGLERARSLYFELFDSAPLPYLLFDQRHHLQELNLAAADLLRGERARLKHRPFFPHLIDQDRPAFHQHLGDVFRDRHRAEVELTVVDSEARQHRMRFVSQIVPAAPGEGPLCMSIAMPIASIANPGPRPSADFVWWPRHLESAGLFSLVTSPDLGCLFIADGLCEMLGIQPTDLLSKSWTSLTHEDSRGEESVMMEQLRSGSRDSYTISKRIRKAGQGVVVARETVTAIRARDGRTHAYLHTVFLEEGDSVQQPASVVRSPGADMEVENWLLVCVEGRAPRLTDAVASRTIQIPEDVLTRWSQLELGDLNQLVLETCAEIARSSRRRVAVRLQDSLPLIRHCGWQMRRLARNLLANAIEASEEEILVTTRQAWVEAELLDPAGDGRPMPGGEYLILEVEDKGCGMSPQVLAKAFEAFFSTKPGRSGLGLTAARAVIERHNGFIRFTSHTDAGATAHVFLPMSPPIHREALTASTETQAGLMASAPPKKILLVDDEPGVRAVVARMVETLGYDVEEAGSGSDALARFKRSPFAYRAVLSDLNMPAMDGMALTREVRRIRPDCGCVVMTGLYDATDWGPEATGPDAPAFLQKPFTLAHLEEALCRQPVSARFPAMRSPSPADLRSHPGANL
ncbi:MAG: response regulator [Verrucomicrobia bacterium]|nr:response regulator [Verrucomicrobiota bacterium]